jgi:hypothetical protein
LLSALETAIHEPLSNFAFNFNLRFYDEEDMGMSYEELGVYGRLRKISRLGPVGRCRLEMSKS